MRNYGKNSVLNYFFVFLSEVNDSELSSVSSDNLEDAPPNISLVKKEFAGRYAISSEEFTSDLVSVKCYWIFTFPSLCLSIFHLCIRNIEYHKALILYLNLLMFK